MPLILVEIHYLAKIMIKYLAKIMKILEKVILMISNMH